jgi:hypothetical protein
MENERQIIYDLIDVCGNEENDSHTVVLMDLIKWLTTDQIVEFVEHFAANHDITIPGYPGFEEYELCMDCQDTYEVNDRHTCQEQPKYISSIVVPC